MVLLLTTRVLCIPLGVNQLYPISLHTRCKNNQGVLTFRLSIATAFVVGKEIPEETPTQVFGDSVQNSIDDVVNSVRYLFASHAETR